MLSLDEVKGKLAGDMLAGNIRLQDKLEGNNSPETSCRLMIQTPKGCPMLKSVATHNMAVQFKAMLHAHNPYPMQYLV